MDRNFLRLSFAALAAAAGLACAGAAVAAEPAAAAAPPKPYVLPAGTADYIVKAVQTPPASPPNCSRCRA